jgi:hypothetical protein
MLTPITPTEVEHQFDAGRPIGEVLRICALATLPGRGETVRVRMSQLPVRPRSRMRRLAVSGSKPGKPVLVSPGWAHAAVYSGSIRRPSSVVVTRTLSKSLPLSTLSTAASHCSRVGL